ncbi:hypothetical protein [Sphingomonas sp. SORGH_AS_0438]|uniref:hypothetical protein n=1 Tax=Sphingomonas sp. SORGH_AS_0438 TaxID=3041756 RepID=UPI00285D131F|nr:hypothetical protein [Sphingomonas sp. SORGH_AS_0438]MDR6128022.1 hypothetical protein [Sphingomonas sp. SORGH_AS_0438]
MRKPIGRSAVPSGISSRPSPPTGPARSASARATAAHSASPSVSPRASISGKSLPEPWHLMKAKRMSRR